MMDRKEKRQIHTIVSVAPGSIAAECGLEPLDSLVSINGHSIEDIFDYQYYIQEEFLRIQIVSKDGEECILEIEKEEDEDLGLSFSSSLMDDYRSCCNRCIFCFIDQMPPGMRETLYFKDDDSRLSFLQGNYITLTNMSLRDIDRINYYHLAPINISVHTTNQELRCRMLSNRFAGDIMDKIRRFYDAGIPMNSQVVLCKGINDQAELDRTIKDLSSFQPHMRSLSVVPVGLTRFREGLYPLEAFDGEEAGKVLDQIHRWQEYFKKEYGRAFVHASDEWFLLAGRDFPEEAYYEGYGQLENGVGMMRLLISEVEERLREVRELGLLPGRNPSELGGGEPKEARRSGKDRNIGSGQGGKDQNTGSGQSGKDRNIGSGQGGKDQNTGSGQSGKDQNTGSGQGGKDQNTGSDQAGDDSPPARRLSLATGKLAYPVIRDLVTLITKDCPWIRAQVYCIENHFFGEQITVAGLLTGQDIISQLQGHDLGEELLLPCNMLKADEDVFLDDIRLEDLGRTLQVTVNIIQSEGRDLVDRLLFGRSQADWACRRSGYELQGN